jgi:hypothetical protein
VPSPMAEGGTDLPDGEAGSPSMKRTQRAEYNQIIQMEANFEKGNAVRAERELTQLRMQIQKEQFKERGRMLRERRRKEAAESSKEAYRQQTVQVGQDIRAQREALRAKREQEQYEWQEYGQDLCKQHSTLREKLRDAATLRQQENRSSAMQMSAELKALTDYRFDDTYARKREMTMSTKAATSSPVIRSAKQSFVNQRWDRADQLRDEMARFRAQRKRNDQEYLEQARAIREHCRSRNFDAHRKMEEDARARGEQIRQLEAELKAERDAAMAAEVERKRQVLKATEDSKRVTEEMEEAKESLSTAFARFFGFRRRGGGQSSVTL